MFTCIAFMDAICESRNKIWNSGFVLRLKKAKREPDFPITSEDPELLGMFAHQA